MKTIKELVILLIMIVLSFVINQKISSHITTTLYTVMGIMFSVGMGLIVSFNLQGVKNKKFIKDIRRDLDSVRDTFIRYFTISTILFIVAQIFGEVSFTLKGISFTINSAITSNLVVVYTIIYFILNFKTIQKLGHDVFDKVN